MKTKEGIAVFVVDYIGLVGGDAKNGRVEEVSSVSRGLKAMAKELDAAVIALSQLNRSCEARDNKRPVLSDLRDSGAIEQDADLVAFVYRDEVYRKDSADTGTAEINVAKQRNGPVGMVRMKFFPGTARFANLSRQ